MEVAHRCSDNRGPTVPVSSGIQYHLLIDVLQKFPLHMKDNDLLITQLFEDPLKEPITSLSVYLTPNVCESISCDHHNYMAFK